MGSANTSFHDGALARVLLGPFRLAFAAALGLTEVLLVAWTVAFVAHVWPGRVEGLRALLAQELTTGTALAARQGVPVAAVTAPANGLYALVFEATGLHEMGQRFAQGAPLPVPDTIVRSAWVARHEAVEGWAGPRWWSGRRRLRGGCVPALALCWSGCWLRGSGNTTRSTCEGSLPQYSCSPPPRSAGAGVRHLAVPDQQQVSRWGSSRRMMHETSMRKHSVCHVCRRYQSPACRVGACRSCPASRARVQA